MSALHALVSSDILPKEYGGGAGEFDNRSWYMELLADEKYFVDQLKYGYRIDMVEEDVWWSIWKIRVVRLYQ